MSNHLPDEGGEIYLSASERTPIYRTNCSARFTADSEDQRSVALGPI
jgi:hypothetical protein